MRRTVPEEKWLSALTVCREGCSALQMPTEHGEVQSRGTRGMAKNLKERKGRNKSRHQAPSSCSNDMSKERVVLSGQHPGCLTDHRTANEASRRRRGKTEQTSRRSHKTIERSVHSQQPNGALRRSPISTHQMLKYYTGAARTRVALAVR